MVSNPEKTGEKPIVRTKKGYFVKGAPSPNPAGRPPGLRNEKTNLLLGIFKVYKELGAEQGLKKWIKASKLNTRDFYRQVLDLLPKTVDVEGEGQAGDIYISIGDTDLLKVARQKGISLPARIARRIGAEEGKPCPK